MDSECCSVGEFGVSVRWSSGRFRYLLLELQLSRVAMPGYQEPRSLEPGRLQHRRGAEGDSLWLEQEVD